MGINTHYYTMYGIHRPYSDAISDKLYETDLYEKFEKKGDCAIIMDGMCGEYMVIGKILFDSGDLRWSEEEDTWMEIFPTPKVLKGYKELAIEIFKEHFPEEEFAEMVTGTWKIITFAHYS